MAPVPSTLTAKDFDQIDPAAGCLAENPGNGVPRFALSDAQRQAIRETLSHRDRLARPLAPSEAVDRKMAVLDCYACHLRGDVGGPDADRNPYFLSAGFAEMGDEGRLPPHLNRVGAKLKPQWLREVLVNHGVVRPYMDTRMPQFGEANVGVLADLLPLADAGTVPAAASPEPAFDPEAAALGRRLVGTKGGFGCINCHLVTDVPSLGVPAIDLQFMFRRLRYDWFDLYLHDPAALRPGTRMPTFWPHNQSVLREELGGDTERQIATVWVYLSQGSQMPLPPGLLSRTAFNLDVADAPVVFRGFVTDVGERSIAVGYPAQVNVAFDATGVRLAEAWHGKFINAQGVWDARGGRYTSPLGEDVVKFPPGGPLAVLATPDAPWPAGEGPEAGYHMRGYRLDPKRVPVFLYTAGGLSVEEQPAGLTVGKSRALVRRFRVTGTSPAGEVWLRAAVGKSIVPKDGGFVVDGKVHVRVTVPTGATARVRATPKGQELLVAVPVTPEAAPDTEHARSNEMTPAVEVELTW